MHPVPIHCSLFLLIKLWQTTLAQLPSHARASRFPPPKKYSRQIHGRYNFIFSSARLQTGILFSQSCSVFYSWNLRLGTCGDYLGLSGFIAKRGKHLFSLRISGNLGTILHIIYIIKCCYEPLIHKLVMFKESDSIKTHLVSRSSLQADHHCFYSTFTRYVPLSQGSRSRTVKGRFIADVCRCLPLTRNSLTFLLAIIIKGRIIRTIFKNVLKSIIVS